MLSFGASPSSLVDLHGDLFANSLPPGYHQLSVPVWGVSGFRVCGLGFEEVGFEEVVVSQNKGPQYRPQRQYYHPNYI